jgi:hypothetical protein
MKKLRASCEVFMAVCSRTPLVWDMMPSHVVIASQCFKHYLQGSRGPRRMLGQGQKRRYVGTVLAVNGWLEWFVGQLGKCWWYLVGSIGSKKGHDLECSGDPVPTWSPFRVQRSSWGNWMMGIKSDGTDGVISLARLSVCCGWTRCLVWVHLC